jgi:hypothetical protein
MKLNSFLLNIAIFTAFLVIPWSATILKVHAQQNRSITVMPPKFELFANPGDIVSERLRVTNNSNFPTTYAIIVEDFSSSGEEGHVVLEEEGTDSAYSLANWIEPEATEIVLQPGEETNVNFNINVPRDAEPGGHYASILLQSSTDNDPNVTNVSQRIGSLALLRVSGNTIEDVNVETFEAPKRSESGPVNFTLRIKNDGNVHVRPKGTIIITNFFGNKVAELPLEGANVLPGATRKMETTWDEDRLLGSYTATLVATYGVQNLPLAAATKFTVASTTSIILLLVAVIAIVIFLISLFTGRNRLKKAFSVLTKG